MVELAGWGTTEFGGSSNRQPGRLQKATVTTLSHGACKSMEDMPATLSDSILCTYSASGRDACQMDSGGGLMWRNYRPSKEWTTTGGGGGDGRLYLVGVISYGRQCGRNTAGFNTRITSYLNWIIANSRGANFCIPWDEDGDTLCGILLRRQMRVYLCPREQMNRVTNKAGGGGTETNKRHSLLNELTRMMFVGNGGGWAFNKFN